MTGINFSTTIRFIFRKKLKMIQTKLTIPNHKLSLVHYETLTPICIINAVRVFIFGILFTNKRCERA